MPRLFWYSRFPVLPGHLLFKGVAALGVALLLAGGSLVGATGAAHASGSCPNPDPTYWIHTATSANTSGNATDLSEYGCFSGLLFVQANWNPGGVYTGFDPHPVGVGLGHLDGVWAIVNEDGAPMPLGAAFTVYDVPYSVFPTDPHAFFFQQATSGSYLTYLDNPELNGNPSAQLMVTPDFGYFEGVVDPHQIGIWYDSAAGRWTIYNEDRAPIPVGAVFNVLVVHQTGLFTNAFTQVATTSNTSGDSTCINSPLSNQNPYAYIFVT